MKKQTDWIHLTSGFMAYLALTFILALIVVNLNNKFGILPDDVNLSDVFLVLFVLRSIFIG